MKEPILTSNQEVIKQLLAYYNNLVNDLLHRISLLYAECEKLGHVIVPRNLNIEEELKKDKWASTGAYCFVCGRSFGWWCPSSPDHLCHYEDHNEFCKYCGMPDERK